MSECKSIHHFIHITSKHIQSASYVTCCGLFFSLRNNWDWYNLLQEQILNQHSLYELYEGEGNKMINIPFIKHHGRSPEPSYYKPNPTSWHKCTQHKLLFNKETLQQKQPKWTGLTEDIWNEKLSARIQCALPLSLTTNEKPPHSWTALLALWLQTPNLIPGMCPAHITLSLWHCHTGSIGEWLPFKEQIIVYH